MMSKVLWALDNETSGKTFERLCVDLLYRNGYTAIMPLGGVHDRGRDAEVDLYEGKNENEKGKRIFFQFSLEKSWKTKLNRELEKVKSEGHQINVFVFMTNQNVTGAALDQLKRNVAKEYGWDLKIYHREWFRLQLEVAHPDLAEEHLKISRLEPQQRRSAYAVRMLFILVLLLLIEPSARRQSAAEWTRIPLQQKPQWVSSGAWIGSRVLVLIDSKRNIIYPYNMPYGKVIEATGTELSGALSRLTRLGPLKIQTSADGRYLLETTDRQFLALSGKLYVEERFDLRPRISGIYNWVTVGSGLFGYGDFEDHARAGSEWSSGLFHAPLSGAGQLKIIDKQDLSDSSRIFFRLGLPLLASLNDVGYVLLMGNNRAGIYRFEGDRLVRVNVLLDAGLDTTTLPDFHQARDVISVMQRIEMSSMPAGIWGWEGYLYVLARAPSLTGGTVWTLFKIDPITPKVLGTMGLQTKAHHLTVVPGPQWWAFIEKGAVQNFGVQDVDGILLIPSDTLRER